MSRDISELAHKRRINAVDGENLFFRLFLRRDGPQLAGHVAGQGRVPS